MPALLNASVICATVTLPAWEMSIAVPAFELDAELQPADGQRADRDDDEHDRYAEHDAAVAH